VVYGFHTMMPRSGGRPNWLRLAFDFLRTPRFNPFDMLTKNKSVMAFNLSYLFSETALLDEAMGHVLGLIADDKLVLPEVTRFPVDKVGEAHQTIESGTTVGKLVLTFGG
jgi:NADPH:quinone reductase-like Zn-dependent oxidoreductase